MGICIFIYTYIYIYTYDGIIIWYESIRINHAGIITVMITQYDKSDMGRRAAMGTLQP